MEVKMNKIENNVVELEVKVESKKFDAALNKAYKKNVNKFNVQGFRKGKVPMAIVKKFYGVEVLYDDALNFIMEETYPKALDDNDIKPVDYPKVDIVEIGEGKDLVYTAEVTTYPEVELGEYKGLDVKKPTYEVNDEEVEKQLASMQEKNARVTTKEEGTVEDKNIAVIDFKGYIDGNAFEGGEGKDFSLEIGSGSFIDNFEEQLKGLAVGDTKEVNVTFPENYGSEELNGKPAKFDVTVKEIKVKEVPALDDEFAKEVSEFETLAELKEDIKKNLQKAEDQKAENEFEEAIITAVIENTKLDLPQVMVEKEIDQMMNDLENRLKYQGLTLDQYMEFTGNTPEKMRDFMKENAERKVKADIIIDAIAKAENIEATEEELKAKALEVAKMYSNGDHEKMADLLVKAQKPMLENEIRIVKTLDLLKSNVK